MVEQFRINNTVMSFYDNRRETVVEVLSSHEDFEGAVIKTFDPVSGEECYWNIEDPEIVEELSAEITEQDIFDLGFTVDQVAFDYIKEIRDKVFLGYDVRYRALWIMTRTTQYTISTVLLKDNLKLHQLQNLIIDLS